MKHLNNFDLLRFIAATLVIFSHSFPLTTGNTTTEPLSLLTNQQAQLGEIGVDIFFIMSGYLIAGSWKRTPELGRFLWARVLRIYPAYIVMLLVVAFGLGPAVTTDAHYWTNPSLWNWFGNVRLYQFQHWLPGVFDDQPFSRDVNDSIWTLGWEFLCYLIIAALGVAGVLNRRFVLLLTLASILIYLNEPKLLTAHFFRFSMYFLVGSVFFLYQEKIRWHRDWALLGAFLVTAALTLTNPALANGILAVAGGYTVLYIARQNWAGKFAWFGDVSYGLYIYGWPVTKLVVYLMPKLTVWGVFATTFSMTFVLALLSWHLIEKPVLQLKNNLPFDRYLPNRAISNSTS